MYSYVAYGLGLHSEIELPGLQKQQMQADISIALGRIDLPVPPNLDSNVYFYGSPTEIDFHCPGVATLAVRNGEDVLVDPATGANAIDVVSLVLARALPAVLQQRGYLVLHGSSAAISGDGMVFLGGVGDGKSTIVAALLKRGFRLLADDVTAVSADSASPTIAPAFPLIKLDLGVVAELGLEQICFEGVAHSEGETFLRIPDDWVSSPATVGQVYLLEWGEENRIEPVTPRQAAMELVAYSFTARLLRDTASESSHFQRCLDIASNIPVHRFLRRRSMTDLDEQIGMLEANLPLGIA